jgi:GNAT superfamily N-acetyltransferase
MTKRQIDIIEVKNKKQLRTFIHLPAKIHKGHANWVPPIYMDEWEFFNPDKNEAFSYSDTILLLAYEQGKCVGRIMGIINHKYNQEHNENDARFFLIETYDDYTVAETLLTAIEKWALAKKMSNLVGPLGFSDKDPQGLRIEGLDEPTVIATICNYAYMIDFVERFGFTKKVDLLSYKIPVPDSFNDIYKRVYERTLNNNKGLKLLSFSKRKQLKQYVKPVLELTNHAFKNIYAFNPLSEKEMNEFAGRYLVVLDPKFAKIIENQNNEVVAYILGIPDICPGIQKSKGYVWPIGFIHILRSQKKAKLVNLLLGGIREDYRNKGLDTILGIEMLMEAKKRGIEYIDSHLILETNVKMLAEPERVGGVVYKRFRIYQKPIA